MAASLIRSLSYEPTAAAGGGGGGLDAPIAGAGKDSDAVKLNVGGTVFTTSMGVLMRDPDSIFPAMFSGRFSTAVDKDGAYPISRDPTYFPYVLMFLRDGTIPSAAGRSFKTLRLALLAEAQFYQLRGLALAMSSGSTLYTDSLNADDLSLRDQEKELRGWFASKAGAWIKAPVTEVKTGSALVAKAASTAAAAAKTDAKAATAAAAPATAAAAAAVAAPPGLPPCQYGTQCYRKNPAHYTEFSHPWLVSNFPGAAPKPDAATIAATAKATHAAATAAATAPTGMLGGFGAFVGGLFGAAAPAVAAAPAAAAAVAVPDPPAFYFGGRGKAPPKKIDIVDGTMKPHIETKGMDVMIDVFPVGSTTTKALATSSAGADASAAASSSSSSSSGGSGASGSGAKASKSGLGDTAGRKLHSSFVFAPPREYRKPAYPLLCTQHRQPHPALSAEQQKAHLALQKKSAFSLLEADNLIDDDVYVPPAKKLHADSGAAVPVASASASSSSAAAGSDSKSKKRAHDSGSSSSGGGGGGAPEPVYPPVPSLVETMDQFDLQFDAFSTSIFQGFDWSGVIVAGGAVLAALLPLPASVKEEKAGPTDFRHRYGGPRPLRTRLMEYYHAGDFEGDEVSGYYNNFNAEGEANPVSPFVESDLDLFFVGLTPDQATQKIRHLHSILLEQRQKHHHSHDLNIVRSAHAITFAFGWPVRHIQVVTRLYANAAEVLMGFDLDSCCLAYEPKSSIDGRSHVWALPRARRAINLRANLVDPERQSLTFESRLFKYSQRGFAVAVPGWDSRRLSGTMFMKRPNQVHGLARLLLTAVRLGERPAVIPFGKMKRRAGKKRPGGGEGEDGDDGGDGDGDGGGDGDGDGGEGEDDGDGDGDGGGKKKKKGGSKADSKDGKDKKSAAGDASQSYDLGITQWITYIPWARPSEGISQYLNRYCSDKLTPLPFVWWMDHLEPILNTERALHPTAADKEDIARYGWRRHLNDEQYKDRTFSIPRTIEFVTHDAGKQGPLVGSFNPKLNADWYADAFTS